MASMARRPRSAPGGLVYHVLNRSAGKFKFLDREKDLQAFENLLTIPMPCAGGCRIVRWDTGTCTKAASRVSRCRRMGIFLTRVDTWSVMH